MTAAWRHAARELRWAVLALLPGCAHVAPPPALQPVDQTGAGLEARSLRAEELLGFLSRNLGRDYSAAPAQPWDFETLAWVAFHYHPSLELARAQWEIAQAEIQTAAARPNPVLTFTPGLSSNPAAGVSPWFPALVMDALLERKQKRELRLTGARLAAEAARQSVFAAAWQIRSELRRALLEFAAAGQRSAGLRAQVDAQQRVLALLEQRRQAGAISANEVSAARLALVRAEVASANATRLAPQSRHRIAQALGVPLAALEGAHFEPPPGPRGLAPAELATARRAALQYRGDVLAALARFDAAQAALELELARQHPDFHLGPGYQWDQGENKWSVALSLELPVWNRNEGPIAVAHARRREAAAQFLATQARALAEIESAAAAHQAARAQIVELARIEAALAQQEQAVLARQRAGRADQLELQTAAVERAAALAALREAESEAALAAGQLEDALQIPFPHLSALAGNPSSPSP